MKAWPPCFMTDNPEAISQFLAPCGICWGLCSNYLGVQFLFLPSPTFFTPPQMSTPKILSNKFPACKSLFWSLFLCIWDLLKIVPGSTLEIIIVGPLLVSAQVITINGLQKPWLFFLKSFFWWNYLKTLFRVFLKADDRLKLMTRSEIEWCHECLTQYSTVVE